MRSVTCDQKLKHNRLASDEMLSNNRRAVGFGSTQLGLRDASIRSGWVGRIGRRNERGFRAPGGGVWTGGVLKGKLRGGGGGDRMESNF